MPLVNLEFDRPATIWAISPENSDVLAYLGKRGIMPGRRVMLSGTAPMQGPLTVKVGQPNTAIEIDLGQVLAGLVFVELEVSN